MGVYHYYIRPNIILLAFRRTKQLRSIFLTFITEQVKSRQIWGDTVYTSDSDLVAVLMHMGFYAHYLSHPPNTVAEFRALLKLLPPQEKYNSRARFVKSRLWCSPGDGCSYQVRWQRVVRPGVGGRIGGGQGGGMHGKHRGGAAGEGADGERDHSAGP